MASEWGWNIQDSSDFSGQVMLIDETGASAAYDRFDGASSAPLWGSTAVQSPIVVAGSSQAPVLSGMFRTGVQVEKLSCPTGSTWDVSLAVTNACVPNTSHNISGIQLGFDDVSATQWTPTMRIHVTGYGWFDVVNNNCGVVQATQTCE